MRTVFLDARQPGASLRMALLAALPLALMSWTPCSSSAAQQVAERQTAFENLADSQWIRLKLSNTAGRYEGRLLQGSSDQLVLSAKSGKAEQAGWPEPFQVAPTMVDTLWVERPATGRGAAVGALLGVAAGAVAGAVACADCQDTSPGAVTVGGAAVGGLLGALVGAGIGAIGQHWVRRYPK